MGQELAVVEIKMILSLTAREFDVCGAYAEWDQLNRRSQKDVKSMDEERAYQIQLGAAHSSDAFPYKVTWANPNGCHGVT